MSTAYCYLPTTTWDLCLAEEEEPYIVETSKGPVTVPPMPPVEEMATIDQVRYFLYQKLRGGDELADLLIEAPDLQLIVRIITCAVEEGAFTLPPLDEE